MRENPPYSLAEIRLRIAQYLDGSLEPEGMLALDDLLTQFPGYQQEFLNLQATRGKVQAVLGQQAETALNAISETGALWDQIVGQLALDQQTAPLSSISAEWVSAYVDGEISRQDLERETFEGQLARNDEANRLLADLTQVSESVKQFGYRQENACTVDITQAVMAAYQAELSGGKSEAASENLDESLPLLNMRWDDWELLSAFTDEALSPREIIQATQLIESSDAVRANLAKLNHLSEQIQRVGQQMQSQAPDLWPAVHEALKALPESEKVVPLARKGRPSWLRRAAVPLAASLLLGMLYLPNLNFSSMNKQSEKAPASSPVAQAESVQSDLAQQPAASRELASVPMSARTQTHAADLTQSLDAATLDDTTAGNAIPVAAPAARSSVEPAPAVKLQALKPILEKPAVADNSISSSVIPADAAAPRKSPSSEAYLFDSLSRQAPDEEISNILGK
jgi:hypothetical protein